MSYKILAKYDISPNLGADFTLCYVGEDKWYITGFFDIEHIEISSDCVPWTIKECIKESWVAPRIKEILNGQIAPFWQREGYTSPYDLRHLSYSNTIRWSKIMEELETK